MKYNIQIISNISSCALTYCMKLQYILNEQKFGDMNKSLLVYVIILWGEEVMLAQLVTSV